ARLYILIQTQISRGNDYRHSLKCAAGKLFLYTIAARHEPVVKIGFGRAIPLKDQTVAPAKDDVIAVIAEIHQGVALLGRVSEVVYERHCDQIVESSRTNLTHSARGSLLLRIEA